MLTIYSEDHSLQNGEFERIDGQLLQTFERPQVTGPRNWQTVAAAQAISARLP